MLPGFTPPTSCLLSSNKGAGVSATTADTVPCPFHLLYHSASTKCCQVWMKRKKVVQMRKGKKGWVNRNQQITRVLGGKEEGTKGKKRGRRGHRAPLPTETPLPAS